MVTHCVILEAEALIDTLPHAPPEARTERLCVTLGNEDPEALVVTLAATPLDGKADTWAHTR